MFQSGSQKLIEMNDFQARLFHDRRRRHHLAEAFANSLAEMTHNKLL
jgi:hypothetical protein